MFFLYNVSGGQFNRIRASPWRYGADWIVPQSRNQCQLEGIVVAGACAFFSRATESLLERCAFLVSKVGIKRRRVAFFRVRLTFRILGFVHLGFCSLVLVLLLLRRAFRVTSSWLPGCFQRKDDWSTLGFSMGVPCVRQHEPNAPPWICLCRIVQCTRVTGLNFCG